MSGTTLPATCEGVNFSVQLPELKCDSSILPDFANMQNFGRQLGSLPGQLGRMALCLAEEKAAQLRDAIKRILKLFDDIFVEFPLSVPTPVFGRLKIPELELELKLTALYNEFKLFWQNLIISILKKIPGLGFINQLLQIPIPFLGGPVLADLFTEEGRAKIRKAVSDKVDSISEALGMPWDFTFNGTLGIKNIEIQVQNILSRIWQIVQGMITNILQSALNVLTRITDAIKKIWDALKLPTLPDLTAFDFSNLFKSIWEVIDKLAISIQEKLQRAIDAVLNFDLKDWLSKTFGAIFRFIPWPFPTIIRKLLDATGKILDAEYNLQSPEIKFSRIMTAVQQMLTNILNMIIELWLQLVSSFLRAILRFFPIIADLLKLIPFTICSFLTLVAAPLFSLPNQVANLIPGDIVTVNPPPTPAPIL